MIKFMSIKTNKKRHIVVMAIFFGLLMVLMPMFLLFTPMETLASANAAAVTQRYTVTFHESGLPNATDWSVNFNGVSSSTSSFVNFSNIAGGTTQTFSIFTVTTTNNQYTPTPSSGTVYVNDSNLTVKISFYNQTTSQPAKGYDLNFTITKFPNVMPGIIWSWTATVSGTSLPYGPVTSPTFTGNTLDYFTGLSNGTYRYSLSPAYGTTLSNSTGLVNIAGKNTTVTVDISLMHAYTVKFKENGLPVDQHFSVSVYDSPTNGGRYSATNTTFVSQHPFVEFFLINQTYSYTVYPPSGYSANPPTGTLTVTGTSFNLTIQFAQSKPSYPVSFHIVNPPTNSPDVKWYWGVTVNGTFYGYSYNSTLLLPNLVSGNYSYITSSYGIALSSDSGTFYVNGTAMTVNLSVTPAWSANFKVTNLADSAFGYPSFTVGIVDNIGGLGGGPVQGSPFSSSGGEILIPSLQNGTYDYTLEPTNNYFIISPTSGTFTIDGKNSTVALTETAQPVYSAQFIEKGLISYSSISWGVVLDNGFYYNDTTPIPSGGLTHVSAPGSVLKELPAGTYWVQAFVIDTGGKYHFMSPMKITVGSADNLYTMQFATYTGSGTLLNLTDYEIIAGISAAVALSAVALFVWKRRGKTGP